jgi:outer membrane receptor protein involved in Fe transport
MTIAANSYRQRLLLAAACGLVAVAAQPTKAWAQAAPAAPVSTEEVVVTGSRLKVNNATSENPVTVITAEDIAKTGSQTVEDVLQRLPAIGASGIYATTNNGGEGASCTDIRNLGITRTLVLVNGRRFVHSGIFGVDCVDLNNIPLDLVERIEVLKDGASAIYGADAVAGVINIVLKKNYNGTVVHADGYISTHGDDRTGVLGFTTGHNFDHGNVTVSVDYLNREPVAQINRAWATPAISGDSVIGGVVIGSGIPPAGRIFSDSNCCLPGQVTVPGSGDLIALGNGKYANYNRVLDAYNYGQEQYLNGGLEKWDFTGLGHYDINDNVTAYVETYFTHKETRTQLAAQPVTGGLNSSLPDAFVVPAGNPYLEQLFGADSGPVDLYKRVSEFGDRVNDNSTDTYQVTGGFEGSLGYGWDYTTFFTYGRSDATIVSLNEVNFQKLEQEVGFEATTPTAAQVNAIEAYNLATYGAAFYNPSTFGVYNPNSCAGSPGCVQINPFGPGAISSAGAAYAKFNETATSVFSLRTFGGSVTNNDLYDLPFGPLGVSLGAEHRREFGEYNPDSLVQSGVTLENSQEPTNGAFDTTEIFGELKIPILAHLPGAEDLHINLGGRFYDYNTFGSGETWKAGFNYTPITGIRFRGNIGDAFREPAINELYGGQALSFNTATDPCAFASTYGGKAGNVIAKCASEIPGYNPATFQQLGNGQVQTITGGNPQLQPETARTETVGMVLEPPMVPRLSFTVDYWRTKIENSIGSVATQDILDGCYTGSAPSFCADIAPRAAQNQLNTVSAVNMNLGVTKTSGIDFGGNYTLLLPGYGSISFNDDFELLLTYVSQNLPNGPFINYAGLEQFTANPTAQPLRRNVATVAWNYNDFTFTYTNRFAAHMGLYPESSYVSGIQLATGSPNIDYSDIDLTYGHGGLTLNLGVQNLFDKDPPFLPDGATNTNVSFYDVLGRVVYIKTTYKF